MNASAIKALIDLRYPNNSTGLITPTGERETLKAIVDFVNTQLGIVDVERVINPGTLILSSPTAGTLSGAEWGTDIGEFEYSGPVTLTANHATLERIDLIVGMSGDTVQVVTGTASENPVFPPIPMGGVLLQTILRKAGSGSVVNPSTSKSLAYSTKFKAGGMGEYALIWETDLDINQSYLFQLWYLAFTSDYFDENGQRPMNGVLKVAFAAKASATELDLTKCSITTSDKYGETGDFILQDEGSGKVRLYIKKTAWNQYAQFQYSGRFSTVTPGMLVNGSTYANIPPSSIRKESIPEESTADFSGRKFYKNAKDITYTRGEKDIIINDGGGIIVTPPFMGNLVFTKPFNLRGVVDALGDKEFTIENSSGEPGTIEANYVGGPANSAFNIPETITVQNGEKLAFKSEDGEWIQSQNSGEVAWSDKLDAVGAIRTVGPDGMEVIDNVLDSNTDKRITLKQVTTYLDGTAMDDSKVDWLIYLKQHNEYFKKVIGTVDLNMLGVKIENTASQNAVAFNNAQSNFPHNCRWSLETGTYRIDDISITKSGVYDFQGVNLINNLEVAGSSISVTTDADTVYINGLSAKYEGILYTSGKPEYEGPLGVTKHGIRVACKKAVLTNCKIGGFSGQGILSSQDNKGLYLIACTSNNNGYAGVLCNSPDFQVIGGEYNENGGSNASGDGYGDGYGIVANVREYGNAKIIGVTACRNRTRNIDSHTGQDIIIQSNYVEEAGAAHPQWFDKPFVSGNNIRFTQRSRRIIIDNNISKKATLSGILCQSNEEGGVNEWYAESVNISNNILDDNLLNIYIRPLKTKSLVIQGNQSFASENISTHDLLIDPQTADLGTVGDLILSGNFFSKYSQINLPTTTNPENSNVKIFGNTIPTMLVACNTANVNIKSENNNLGSFTVTGTNANAKARVVHNTISGAAPTLSSFSGHVTISENDISDVSGSTLIIVGGQTSIERNNFYNCVASSRIISMTSSVPENIRIVGNYFHPDCSGTDIIRFYPKPNIVVRDNSFTGRATIVKSSGSQSSTNRITFDPINREFDFGFRTQDLPVQLGDYTFSRGDIVKNSTISPGEPEGWIYVTGNTWLPYGFSERPLVEVSGTNYNLASADVYSFLNFTGSAGNVSVLTGRFVANKEINGIVSGGTKTFVAGAGFTLTSSTGEYTAPQNSRIDIKFKSDTEAVITIIKPDADYNSFIPTITGSVSNPTFSYSEQFGRYAKIGRLCYFDVRITWESISGGSGNVRIALPFTKDQLINTGGVAIGERTGIDPTLQITGLFASSTVGFKEPDGSDIAISDLESLGTITISGTFITES